MLLTPWLRALQSAALFSPRLFGRRRNLRHHRQWQKRRHTRGQALAAAGLEKLEDRILLAAPVFNQGTYTFSVSENTPPPYSVGQVSVGDADFMDTHTFSILAGNEHDRFAMSTAQYPGGAMGYVRLVNPLDYERQAQYQLTVEVRDSTGLTDTATVFVNIGDVAEEGDGDANFHANADADATGEAPAAVSDGGLSVNQLTGDALLRPAIIFGVLHDGSPGNTGDELPVYQSGTLARPIVNVDAQLQAGNLPTRIDATLTFGGLQQQTVSFNVDSSLDGQQVRLALPADATTLGTGHYNWSAAVTLVYSGSSSTQNFSGKREIINETNSPVGAGWRIAAVDRLHFDGTGGATLARGDGTAAYFAYSNGTLKSPAGSFSRLVNNGDGTHSLIRHHGGEDVFNSTTGLLIKRRDLNGQETAFSYTNGDGGAIADDLAQIAYSNGRTAVYTWSSNKLQSVTDSKGRTFSIARHTNGQIESLTGPDPDSGGIQISPVVRLAYHATTGLLETVTDPANETSTIGWSAARRVAQYTRPDTTDWTLDAAQTRGYSAPVKTSDVAAVHTDARGEVWSRKTDRFGYVTQETTPLSHTHTISRDGFGLRTGETNGAQFGWKNPDWKGRVVSQTNADGTVESWTFGNDSFPDNPTSYTDAKGRTWNLDYDSFGNLTDVQSPDGGLTEYAWNSAGLLASITLPDPDAAGPRVRPVTTIQYDTSHRPVTITNPDSTTRTLTWSTTDDLTSETDELGRTTTYTHDTWGRVLSKVLPDPDSTGPLAAPVWQWVYSSRGEVVQEIDPAGNVTDFTFDEQGRLIKLEQPAATTGGPRPTWQWTFDANSNVLTEHDPNGNVTSHTWDDANRRISTTLADPDGPTGPLTAPVWQTAFDQWNRVIQTTDPLGQVMDLAYYAWTTAPSGDQANAGKLHTVTLADPDGAGSAARPVITHTWDRTGNLLSQSDPLNRVTSWVRDSLDRVTETHLADPDGAGVGQPAPVYETVWDAISNVLVRRDALGNEVAFTYDIMSRPLTRTGEDPDDTGPLTAGVTTFEWTATGMLSDVTDALGRTVTTTFDNLDRAIKQTLAYPSTGDPGTVPVWTWQHDILSRVVVETDPNGNSVQHTWDHLSRRTSSTLEDPDAGGPLTSPVYSWSYDLLGNTLSETDSLGRTVSHAYDKLSRRIQTTLMDPDATGPLLAPVYAWSFDSMNNLLVETGPDGAQTQHSYDGLNRRTLSTLSDPDSGGPLTSPTYGWGFDAASQLVSQTDPLGRQVDYIRDGLGRVTETRGIDPDGAGSATRPVWQAEFDLVGNVLVERDPLGHERTHAYDALYRRTLTTLEDPDAGGPLQSPTIGYTWDSVSNMLSLRDPENNTTTWEYDLQNRMFRETNELGHTRVTTFDNLASPVTYTDRNGRVTEFVRDNLYRVTQEKWKDSGGNVIHTITSTWDAASQLTSISDAFATYAYTRDDLGRVIEIDNTGTPGVPDVVLTQTWDMASRRTGLSASIDGTADFVNTYQFDTMGRMTRIQQTDGNASAGYTVSDKRIDLAYRADGAFDTIKRYEDLTATYLAAQTAFGYDDAGRLLSMDHTKGQTTLAAHDWTLDAAGRITSYTSLADGTMTFGYDNNWQITSADYSGSQADESFSWDANGNPTMTGWTVDSNNRLTSDGTYNYLYDNEGNRTRRTKISTGEYVDYDWDHRSRLTDVTFKTSAGVTTKHVRYSYDAGNRLVLRQVDTNGDGTFDQSEAFVYDGADMVLVFNGTGSLTHRFLPDAATDAMFADEDAQGEVLWNLPDHQGTIRDVADYTAGTDTTAVVNHVQYDSFGTITSQSNSAYEPSVAYTGMYRDPDTGLQKHGERWYDTEALRWLNEDPSGLGPDSNPYRWIGNSPANFVDPTGLSAAPYGPWGPQQNYAPWYANQMARLRAMATVSSGPVGDSRPWYDQFLDLFDPHDGAVVTTVEGVGTGVWNGTKNAAVDTWGAITNPGETLDGLGYAVTHPKEAFQAIAHDYMQKLKSAEGVGELIAELNPWQKLGKLGQLKKMKKFAKPGGKVEVPGCAGGACKLDPTCFVAGTQVILEVVDPQTIVVESGEGANDFGLMLGLVGGGVVWLQVRPGRARRHEGARRLGRKRHRLDAPGSKPLRALDAPQIDEAGAWSGPELNDALLGIDQSLLVPQVRRDNRSCELTDDMSPAAKRHSTDRESRVAPEVDRARTETRGARTTRSSCLRRTMQALGFLLAVGLGGWAGTYLPAPWSSAGEGRAGAVSGRSAYRTAGIEQVRVGQRLRTAGVSDCQNCATDVQPGTWRLVRLRMDNVLADGTPDPVEIESLRPLEWIAEHDAHPGQHVPVPLDLADMGLPEELACHVVAVEPCPAIAKGAGRVVLNTVTHLNSYLFDLVVEDAAGREETIRTTGHHKFRSRTRSEWVSADTLAAGESLEGMSDALTVAALERVPGTFRVYNLTVEGEHVFRVSDLGVLVHNNDCTKNVVNIGGEGEYIPQSGEVVVNVQPSFQGNEQLMNDNLNRIKPLTNQPIVVAEGNKLPFADGSVDKIVSNNAPRPGSPPNYMGTPPTLDEISRVLKPGGTTSGSTFGGPDDIGAGR